MMVPDCQDLVDASTMLTPFVAEKQCSGAFRIDDNND